MAEMSKAGSVGAPRPALGFVAVVAGQREDFEEFFYVALDGVTVDCVPKPLHPVFDGGGVDLARMARDLRCRICGVQQDADFCLKTRTK